MRAVRGKAWLAMAAKEGPKTLGTLLNGYSVLGGSGSIRFLGKLRRANLLLPNFAVALGF